MTEPVDPPTLSVPPPPPVTVIEVVYPRSRGTIGVRGSHAPLSWEHTEPPTRVEGDHHFFTLEVAPGDIVEFKLVRNEDDWAGGRNYAVHAGDHLRIEPYFDGSAATLEAGQTLDAAGQKLTLDVLLPPSYAEQDAKRYPVLYVLDGQSLWSSSKDPFGIWHLDETLAQLFDLGAVDELLVVGIHCSEERLGRLTPVADPEHGGGGGEAFLKQIVEQVKPFIDGRYRTRPERETTGVLGSSLGGLFAFYAAWSRPDVFGVAGCLSSSFWWANRWAVRWAQEKGAPTPRPVLYLDSGAPMNPLEGDANAKDGFHHTRSMFRALVGVGYDPGKDLHRLVFTGHSHDAGSWAARAAIPLQILFPPEPAAPSARAIRRVAPEIAPAA